MAKKKFYRPILYYLLVAAKSLFSLLPLKAGLHFGDTIGRLCSRVLTGERNKMLTHLRMAFGDTKSEEELQRIADGVFVNFGRMMAEMCLHEKIIARFDEYVRHSGLELLDKALADGKGAIGIVSHFGNWELTGGSVAFKGYPASVLARRIYYEKYDKLLVRHRSRFGMETFYRDGNPRAMLRAILNNRLVGFVVDQDVDGVDGVFCTFFGQPAYSPSAPVRLAIASGAPMIPIFGVREGDKHHIIIGPVIPMDITGDKEKDVITNTQKWVSIQEDYIRRYPEQWVWNHRRWKTRPKS